jgi:hypothetical protein
MIFHIISHLAISRQENKGHASTSVLHSKTRVGGLVKKSQKISTIPATDTGDQTSIRTQAV